MSDRNPIQFGRELAATLRRYLATTLPINHRHPRLAGRIRKLLDEVPVVKGPYVEALPDFVKGPSLQALTEGENAILHPLFSQLPDTEYQRPLHKHQSEALQTICRDHRNAIIATGTCTSSKTINLRRCCRKRDSFFGNKSKCSSIA